MAKEEQVKFEITAIDNASRVFNQVAASAKGLEKTYDSLKGTFEGVIAAFSVGKIVAEAVEWERASLRLNSVLKATASSAGLTRRELDEMASSLSESTPFNETDIRNAEANLLKFGNIHEEVFREALKLSVDYAAFTGGNVTSATQAIGRALADPVNGLKALQREFGNLTFTQKEYIANLEAQGKTEEAQIAILDIVRNKIGGTGAASNTGLTGLLGVLRKAWDEVGEASALAFEKMQKFNPGGFLPGIETDPRQMGPFQPPPQSWEEQMAKQNAILASINAKAAEAEDRRNEAHTKAVPILAQWNKLLRDQTNEERALDLVLKGEARTWNDLDKAKLLNLAVELDYRRIYRERMDLAGMYAKALRDETLSEEENLSTRVKVIQDQWQKGTRETFQDYIRHAKDGAEQAAFFFKNAFQNMEDALVQFAMTGKVDFHAFANSVVSDLIRIQVRQQLAGFASNAGVSGFAGGFGGSFFGFGTTTPAIIEHAGGIVGEGAPVRSVHSSYFHNAPRMHRGGLAGDEVPAILQRGEMVIPRGSRMGGIVQHFHIGGDVTRADLAAVAAAGRDSAIAFIAEARRRAPSGPFGG